MRVLRVAVAQINPTVGDLNGNAQLIRDFHQRAAKLGADIVAYPELALTGYPPEDLVLHTSFQKASVKAMTELAGDLQGPVAVVGFVDAAGGKTFNAAAVVADGQIVGKYYKRELPNYGVFDERRTFTAGIDISLFEVGGVRFAVTICEDLWIGDGPVSEAASLGAELVININASPFHKGKTFERQILIHQRSVDHSVAIIYGQLVGGQDELVFDGGSLIYDRTGHLAARGSHFTEELITCELEFPEEIRSATKEAIQTGPASPKAQALEPHIPRLVHSPIEEIYEALLLGTRDYVRKNGFDGAIIGMSGGIDSALTATIASDALGPENVLGVAMPSVISEARSLDDAKETAANLGIDFNAIPIADVVDAFHKLLDQETGTSEGLWAENLQSRVRGTLLMSISNATGRIVLTTGNKSELAVGYSTLYGDMAGGFAVLKDVPKTIVYELANYRNTFGLTAIPDQVITRPPSAELRPDQQDTDSLPPYEILDPILEAHIERRASRQSLVEAGFDAEIVDLVLGLVARAEYKRRQAPPGVKITPLSFGRDRRMPITNRSRL